MEITLGPLSWTTVDEQNFRTFLLTETGARLIPKLLENSPMLLEDGSRNRLLVRNGMSIGYQAAARNLLDLAYAPPALSKLTSEYPDLLDDNAWQDGQKINPSTK